MPQFSLAAFTAAVEPLRLANRAAGRPLYAWQLFSRTGEAVVASSSVELRVDGSFADARRLDAAVVCSGLEVQAYSHRELLAALRRLSSHGASVGAVCTGTHVLAKAGLLDGYRATVHWENHAGLVAEFPHLEVSQELFEIDRGRFTCAGGEAATDMMLSIIARDHGGELAAQVTDQLIHHRIREPGERQRINLRTRLGVAHPRLLEVVELMESRIEEPLSCAELAAAVGSSTRQLERLFCRYLGKSPMKHYIGLRLQRARQLLRQTSMPILAVALSCGFPTASHFSKSYFEHFGCSPSAERRRATAVAPAQLAQANAPQHPAEAVAEPVAALL
ncbi:GlxA family transcriptional regulator (plasmid) [Geminicoccaceae bacterium 1502E]|nr:GlxA family transcriptional regulator [Geminicoccaceae bacterium 1502E]